MCSKKRKNAIYCVKIDPNIQYIDIFNKKNAIYYYLNNFNISTY